MYTVLVFGCLDTWWHCCSVHQIFCSCVQHVPIKTFKRIIFAKRNLKYIFSTLWTESALVCGLQQAWQCDLVLVSTSSHHVSVTGISPCSLTHHNVFSATAGFLLVWTRDLNCPPSSFKPMLHRRDGSTDRRRHASVLWNISSWPDQGCSEELHQGSDGGRRDGLCRRAARGTCRDRCW